MYCIYYLRDDCVCNDMVDYINSHDSVWFVDVGGNIVYGLVWFGAERFYLAVAVEDEMVAVDFVLRFGEYIRAKQLCII